MKKTNDGIMSDTVLYSKSAEYGIQAMIYLAEHKPEKPVMIRKIAEEYGIPYQFLAKIMQILVKHHLIKATRGRTGGVELGREPKNIYLSEIIYAIDGLPPEKDKCVIGLDLCSDDTPCPLHEKWKPIRNDIRDMLESKPLNELAKRVIEKRKKMHS